MATVTFVATQSSLSIEDGLEPDGHWEVDHVAQRHKGGAASVENVFLPARVAIACGGVTRATTCGRHSGWASLPCKKSGVDLGRKLVALRDKRLEQDDVNVERYAWSRSETTQKPGRAGREEVADGVQSAPKRPECKQKPPEVAKVSVLPALKPLPGPFGTHRARPPDFSRNEGVPGSSPGVGSKPIVFRAANGATMNWR